MSSYGALACGPSGGPMNGFDAVVVHSDASASGVAPFVDGAASSRADEHFDIRAKEARRSSPGRRKVERVACGVALGISVLSNLLAFVAIALYSMTTSASSQAGGASSNTGGSSAVPFNGSCPFDNIAVLGEPNATVVSVGAEGFSICWTAHKHNARVSSYAYELQMDDWFSNDTALSPIYIGDFRGVTLKNLLPATMYRLRLVVHSGDLYAEDGSEPHFSEVVSVTTVDSPACGNANDLRIFRSNGLAMGTEVQQCYIQHIIGGEAPTVQCIVDTVKLSEGCSKCWYDFSGCAVSKCIGSCLNPTSPDCVKCTSLNCAPAQAKCGGVPMWSFSDDTDG